MSNYKIRVNSESESKEVQQLFFELGYNWFKKGYVEVKTPETIMSFENGALSTGIRGSINHKEITLPELRDLVVLKRNDRNDRTHTDQDNWSWFISSNGTGYVFGAGNANGLHQWDESSLNMVDLKPIEKTMKEYLIKSGDGKYLLTHHDSIGAIEIPEGSETFNYYDRKDNLFFLKGSGEDTMFSNDLNDWDWKHWGNIDFDGVVCLWSRHTNPEELPFIDDEPKLDTQMACMEREFERDQCMENARREGLLGDPRIGAPLNTYDEPSVDTYKSEFGIEPPISLNDQYAEIETVRQTLNQRQSQYGSFEDVAMITEQMVDIMRKGYYENLAYNQKMALYMICSKMARIVNGNPNHKDSWHDIAGYATLIDNELVSEKDMPF